MNSQIQGLGVTMSFTNSLAPPNAYLVPIKMYVHLDKLEFGCYWCTASFVKPRCLKNHLEKYHQHCLSIPWVISQMQPQVIRPQVPDINNLTMPHGAVEISSYGDNYRGMHNHGMNFPSGNSTALTFDGVVASGTMGSPSTDNPNQTVHHYHGLSGDQGGPTS
ncbi:hypothetical protein F4781DRAFT_383470, partial [Annulohypoxylon bovei var. microspora]